MLIDRRAADDPPSDYSARVNRAIDHVLRHLDRPIRLEEVAEAACFSPFHFHRVFRALVGETLQQFVKRLRLERALTMMSHRRRASLTEIALACGFSSSSDFTRCFKKRYGVPPRAFDLRGWRDERREDLDRAVASSERYHVGPRLEPGANPDGFDTVVRDLPPRRVAYIRVLDPFRGTGVMDAYARLLAWAEARGLADRQWLGYMWEDPEVVALTDCRYDVGLEIGGFPTDGGVGTFDFPALRVAEVRISGDLALELRALEWLFGTWLPTSGYLPANQPSFEAWVGRPFAHGDEHFEIVAQLPIVKSSSRLRRRSARSASNFPGSP